MEPAVRVLVAPSEDARPSLASPAEGARTPRRALDLRDMLDELPSLAALKDKKWMKLLPSLPRRPGRARQSPSASPTASTAGSDSMELSPVWLPTPKTAMEMSALVPGSSDEMLTSLDPRFFTEEFDPIAFVLESLPDDREELDLFLRTEISAVDVAKDVILSQLKDEVRANHDALIQGMTVVQEVDFDIVRAQIHVKNGRRLLENAKADLLMNSLEIVKMKRNRDRVQEIIRIGNQVTDFFDEENNMTQALQSHKFTTAVDICTALRTGLSSEDIRGLSVLTDITSRTKDFIPKLREQFDTSLRKIASQFDPLQYKELLHAYISLADHSENLGFEFSSLRLSDVLSSIPEIVVRCIDDVSRQFVRQTFHIGSPRSSNAKAVRENRDGAGDASAQSVQDVMRFFERMTNLMHTYYLLVQWHRDPFNPHNDSMEHLHRCGIDDDDDDDDEIADEDFDEENQLHNCDVASPSATDKMASHAKARRITSPRRRRNSSAHSESGAAARSPYTRVLCETGMTLLRYRKIVWENIQQNVLEVLDRLDLTYGYKMDHIIALSHATTKFIEVGEEFTGTPSTKLRSLLRVKSEQYLKVFHEDNVELVRMLLDTENWQRVMASMEDGDDNAGLLRLIEKRSGYIFELKTQEDLAVNPIYSRRVFPSFHLQGNPFSAENSSQWLSLKQGRRFQQRRRTVTYRKESDIGRSSTEDSEVVELPMMDANEPELVLSSSTLSGYVRLCGVYLKMMEHLPHVAWDTFLLLNKLFEFQLYVVFTTFVEKDDIANFLRGRGGCASGFAELKRWNTLRAAICRIADEATGGELYLQSSVLLFPVGGMGKLQPIDRKVTLRRLTRMPSSLERASDSNLFALAERSIACESVGAQARLLNAIEELARSYLPDRYRCLMNEVYERNRAVVAELREFMYTSIAIHLVDCPGLLDAVGRVRWDLPYGDDASNDYVVHVVQKCGEAWGGLQIAADGSVSTDAREEIWAAMVQSIMETLLSGFARVPKCTPQGRAHMTLDLYALQNGLDLINHISSKTVPRGWEYVNNYIKAFFKDKEELLQWIEANKAMYSKVHVALLIKNGIGPKMDKRELRSLVLQVDSILD